MRITPLRITAAYALLSGAWILLSDRAVNALGLPPDDVERLSIAKGWLFVVVTALLLFVLARALVRTAEHERDRARAILEASPNAILTVGSDQRIRYANPACTQVLGGMPGTLVGRSIDELLPPSVRDAHPDAVRAWFTDVAEDPAGGVRQHPLHAEVIRLDSGDSIPVEILLAPLEALDGREVVVTVVDLSDRAALEARLRQADRLEVLGKFAGILAHDVRNAFAAIGWSAETLARDLPDGDPLREEVGTIEAAVHDGVGMTQSVLEFARAESGPGGPVDLAAHLDRLSGTLRRLLGERCRLEVRLDPALPRIRIPESALTQVLVNLATNARDAMPDGGTFSITAAIHRPAATARLGRRHEPQAWVRITARDTGTGMDAETRSRVFEPFFTTKARGAAQGTGLGLAGVFVAVTRAGGVVDVESEPGAGAAFHVDIPAEAA